MLLFWGSSVLHSQSLLARYPYSWNDWDVQLELLLLRRGAGELQKEFQGFPQLAWEPLGILGTFGSSRGLWKHWEPLGILEAFGNIGVFWDS